MKVELRVFLPDDSITTVTVLKCHKTVQVYQVSSEKHSCTVIYTNMHVMFLDSFFSVSVNSKEDFYYKMN